MKTVRHDKNYKLLYGDGLANSLSFMLAGFRGWQCYGLVKIADHMHSFGVDVGGVPMCAVYGSNYEPWYQSDNPTKEECQISMGNLAIVLFHGIDNESWMRRMTPEEFETLALSHYEPMVDDLFYNS